MPITANPITVAQKHEPEANCDLVTAITVNAGATFDLSTPVGQNDNRMVVQEVRTYVVGASNTLESVAGAIDIQTAGVKAAQLDSGAVTTIKILDANVTEAKLATDSVSTNKIVDANVTLAKLAADAATDLGIVTSPTTATVTNTTGTDAIIPLAAIGGFDIAGLMTKTQVDKLAGIADNANLYVHPNHTGEVTSTGDGATVIADGAVVTDRIADANVTLAKLAGDAVTNLSTSQAATEITVNCSTGTNAVIPRATSTLSGLVNGSEHDALNPVTMSLIGNPEIATATAKSIVRGSLPTQPAAATSRFIGWDAGGLLAEFDPLALTATSRKADIDDLGTVSTGTLAVDWDSGTYDNKQVTLGADLLTVTFTATRSGRYAFHVLQDATGYRKLFLTSVNTSPQLLLVPLAYAPGNVTTIAFDYNHSTGIWSW